VKLADRRVGIARGGHWPQLDFVGNYYFDRTGLLATSEWDAAVVVNIPIYQGGGVQASVREALEQKRVASLDASEGRRRAEANLRVLYQNYLELLPQLKVAREASRKAEEAYRINSREYQFGQVTNLEVIQSLNVYMEMKRSYDALLAGAHMTLRNLEASVGMLP
jgi:outer membrane protein TolC